MTVKPALAETVQDADKALAALSDAVEPLEKGSGNFHKDASGAFDEGCKHDQHADEGYSRAAGLRKDAAEHFVTGKDEDAVRCREEAEACEKVADRHADLGDSYHQLAAHYIAKGMPGIKKAEGEEDKGDSPWMKFAGAVDTYHRGHHEACMKRADEYEHAAMKAADRPDLAEKATSTAKGLRDRAASRMGYAEMCAGMGMAKAEGEPVADDKKPSDAAAAAEDGKEPEEKPGEAADAEDKKEGDAPDDKKEAVDKPLDKDDVAMADGSFPILTKDDVANAITAHGRVPADRQAAVKEHIRSRAAILKAEDKLPGDWKQAADASVALTAEQEAEKLAKGLNIVTELGYMLKNIKGLIRSSLIEQLMEGDAEDQTPQKLKAWLTAGIELLRDVVANETAEALAGKDIDLNAMPMSTAPFAYMAKGTVHGTLSDALIDSLHDKLDPAVFEARKQLAFKLTAASEVFKKAEGTAEVELAERLAKADAEPKVVPDPKVVEDLAAAKEALAKAEGERDAAAAEAEQALGQVNAMTARMIPLAKAAHAQREQLKKAEGVITSLDERLTKMESQPLPQRGKGATTFSVDRTRDGTAAGLMAVRDEVLEKVDALPPGLERGNKLLEAAHAANHAEKMLREGRRRGA